MDYKVFSTELAGRPLTIEFGKYAQQANGSAFVRFGDTVVMVNATMSETAREGVDFFPLSVDFEEKQYSVGKIPGGFIKREGRPTEKATLTCRLIDRPLRPLFPKGMRNDVQVVATCLSVDKDIPPEVPAMIGSSAALSVSDIPWGGPTGTVVVGCVDGELVLCPNAEQREKSTLHLTVSGTKEAVLMVEAGAKEVPEELMLRAILFGHEEIKKIVAFIEGIQQEIGKEKAEVALVTTGEDVKAAVANGLPFVGASVNILEYAKATIPGFDFKIQWIIEEGMYGPEEVYNDYEALFNVEYGDSLITASYAADGDFTTYTKGGSIISAYPQEATVLMRAGSQDDFYKAGWWNGIDDPDGGLKGQVVAIDYQSGGLDMTVFCTSITNKAHQTDDYRLATNAIYSKLLGADFTVSDAGQDEPVPEPVPEPSSPRTGDDMNVVAWTAAAVLSMGMAAVFTTRKKAR